MVKHIIVWDFPAAYSEEEKEQAGRSIKGELEGLVGMIEGLHTLQVLRCPLSPSDGELMLYSEFESEEALAQYQQHPEHQRIATTIVRPSTVNRRCFDYKE